MTISLTFEFDSAYEAEAFLRERRQGPETKDAPVEHTVVISPDQMREAMAQGAAHGPFDEPAPRKRGRPRKVKAAPAAATAVADVAPVPAAAPKPTAPAAVDQPFTLNDVRRVMERVVNVSGMPAAIEFLQRDFGVSRIVDLKPEQYAAVIEACA